MMAHPQWCKKKCPYSHFCPGVTGGGGAVKKQALHITQDKKEAANHLKPSSLLSFLHHVRGRDDTAQSPREKQQNQSRARSRSNTTAWKARKSL